MRAVIRKALTFTAVSAGFLALWVVLLERWAASVAPGGDTLAACLAKTGDPWLTEVFTQDGQEYLLLRGHITHSFPRFPSGPPVYVFDRTGKLVDWAGDSGDNTSFWTRWPGTESRREITRDELMRWPGAT